MKTYYKVLTHDLRPPLQGGDPLWAGGAEYPVRLPATRLDEGEADCAAGWNACERAHDALRIAGLWSVGRPARLFEVESESDWIARGDKTRTAGPLRIVRELSVTDEILAKLHESMAGAGLPIDDLVVEVQAWRGALARPNAGSEAEIELLLREALQARGLLDWPLRRFTTAMDVWTAWSAWAAGGASAWAARDARDAWAARAARDARDAWNAKYTRAARARDAWYAWDPRDARYAWNARYAWDAWDAWCALTHFVAVRRGWLPSDDPHRLTGIREAYKAGLQLAIPVGPKELGWA